MRLEKNDVIKTQKNPESTAWVSGSQHNDVYSLLKHQPFLQQNLQICTFFSTTEIISVLLLNNVKNCILPSLTIPPYWVSGTTIFPHALGLWNGALLTHAMIENLAWDNRHPNTYPYLSFDSRYTSTGGKWGKWGY